MMQLGYSTDAPLMEAKLREFAANTTDSVFVAELEGGVVGCVSCHITSLFHQQGYSGRITSLVIDQNHQRQGIGTALVIEAERFFKANECIKAEVTSANHRSAAHAFYNSCGFKEDEPRFIKPYC